MSEIQTKHYEKICRNIPEDYQLRVYDFFLDLEGTMLARKNDFFKSTDQVCHCAIVQTIPTILMLDRGKKNFWNKQYRKYFKNRYDRIEREHYNPEKVDRLVKQNNSEYAKKERAYLNSLDADIKACVLDAMKHFPIRSCNLCYGGFE